jgi:hypothetical protein
VLSINKYNQNTVVSLPCGPEIGVFGPETGFFLSNGPEIGVSRPVVSDNCYICINATVMKVRGKKLLVDLLYFIPIAFIPFMELDAWFWIIVGLAVLSLGIAIVLDLVVFSKEDFDGVRPKWPYEYIVGAVEAIAAVVFFIPGNVRAGIFWTLMALLSFLVPVLRRNKQ